MAFGAVCFPFEKIPSVLNFGWIQSDSKWPMKIPRKFRQVHFHSSRNERAIVDGLKGDQCMIPWADVDRVDETVTSLGRSSFRQWRDNDHDDDGQTHSSANRMEL